MKNAGTSGGELPTETPQRLRRLHALWEDKARKSSLPARSAFAAEELRPWMGDIILLDVLDDGRDFRYRLHGTNLVRLFGQDLTGRTVAALERHYRDELLEEYRAVARSGRPIVRVRERPIEKDFISVCRLVLPLASDGRTVDKLMVCIHELDSFESAG